MLIMSAHQFISVALQGLRVLSERTGSSVYYISVHHFAECTERQFSSVPFSSVALVVRKDTKHRQSTANP